MNYQFYVIRRRDTGQFFRPAKGPTWARRGNWTSDVQRAKIYGNVGNAKSARKAVYGDFKPSEVDQIKLDLVQFDVKESGVIAED